MEFEIIDQNYSELKETISNIITKAKIDITQAGKEIMIKAYWEIGSVIYKADVSENTIKDLASSLEIERSHLTRCLTFYLQNQTAIPSIKGMTWSHYKELLPIKDPDKRHWYQQQVSKQGLSRNQLKVLLRTDLYLAPDSTEVPKILKRPTDPSYLYRAKLTDVIDGDTIKVHVDLGFTTWKEMVVRLAELDCPELATKQGKEAKIYVEEKLKVSNYLIIKTVAIDPYSRYIAHVFYNPANPRSKNIISIFTKGNYLNEEILKDGHARRFIYSKS